ncbi:MAG: outer membrane lipoprotein-sorting protein [Opitutaceae bacterium]|nr:outer membrane lipoprotein-sorting protein [Verrucomicrobiales bacterium]
MNPKVRFFVLAGFLTLAIVTAVSAADGDEPASGEDLAARLRSLQPAKMSEITGILKIRAGAVRKEVPFLLRIEPSSNDWKTTYEIAGTADTAAEKFVVIHRASGSNDYFFAKAARSGDQIGALQPMAAEQTAVPLAGSDFWLGDLALDFLRWPQQRKLKGEMRLGQPCYVLESVNPAAKEVVKVKSWIVKEAEAPAILVAEAYDAKGKQVKEFTISGGGLRKVNGQYQLEEMKIRNYKTGSQTTLKFNLPGD